MVKKGRILSGMRPTGKLHLGNYLGALQNWVKLQTEYESYHEIADWHALTTGYADTSELRTNTVEVAKDFVAAGLDPETCTIFVQSHVKEHAELHLILSMVTPTPWLLRNPTLKEQARDLGLVDEGEDISTVDYGHLGYPVLQAADILIYKADLVPVGEDQLPHVELTREIARRFNSIYGKIFPEPQAKLTEAGRLPGLDGRRMSKSIGNIILLSDSSESIQKKVAMAVTDPAKIRKGDPGHPEICTVFNYHSHFNKPELEDIRRDCSSGVLGCVDCKRNLSNKLTSALAPIRERRAEIEANPRFISDVLNRGAEKARKVARETMVEVYEAIGIG